MALSLAKRLVLRLLSSTRYCYSCFSFHGYACCMSYGRSQIYCNQQIQQQKRRMRIRPPWSNTTRTCATTRVRRSSATSAAYSSPIVHIIARNWVTALGKWTIIAHGLAASLPKLRTSTSCNSSSLQLCTLLSCGLLSLSSSLSASLK